MTSGSEGSAARDAGRDLADWLESLDLAGALAEAGLPTYVRSPRGVHWTAPRTGEPLTEPELTELEATLRDQGEDPAHAVPLGLLQVRRRAEVRARLVTTPWFDYAALGRLRGEHLDTARFWVHKAASAGRALIVPTESGAMIPAFQFDPMGELRTDLDGVLDVLLAAGVEPWAAWAWLTEPVALLSGGVPHEVVRDPAERDVVRHAARRLAARQQPIARPLGRG
ncbi:hypothetical protein [Nocardioides daejeonensis]|uniref:hypothetical protein n=1 Tax=Nocardioides daejeonensis TaxID=1046556 RepID=UPI000D74B126|nr:hypothetical protein [Nocardioides daejeonensis]